MCMNPGSPQEAMVKDRGVDCGDAGVFWRSAGRNKLCRGPFAIVKIKGLEACSQRLL